MTENPSLEWTRPIDDSADGVRTREAPIGLQALMRELEPRRGARLGSIIEVVDRVGRTSQYELVGPAPGPWPVAVTPASPTGGALWGARPGDAVRITLPNGRERRVRVTSATPGELVRSRVPSNESGSPA